MLRNRAHQILAGALIVSIALSGCVGIQSEPTPTQTKPTGTTSERTTHSISDDSYYLGLFTVSNSTAMNASGTNRTRFEQLTDSQQSVFRDAVRGDPATLNGEFPTDKRERDLKFVLYDGDWYRIAVVEY